MKGLSTVKITVAMSVFNGRVDWLDAAIRSVLNQTYKDFEFLIVNDGSTDSAVVSYLAGIEKLDSRIRLFHVANKGLCAALNFILKYAQGKYFARMDHDDISLPHRLARQVEFLDNHPNVIAVSSWYDFIDDMGMRLKTVRTVTDRKKILHQMMHRNNPIPHAPAMFRTSALRSLGGYSELFGTSEDYELWFRILATGEVVILPEVLYEVRVSSHSVSYTNIGDNQRTHWLVWKTWDLRRQGVENAYEQALAKLNKWKWYYERYFKAEGLRVQASRERMLGNKREARRLLASAWRITPWNPVYPLLWVLTFFR